MDTSRLRKPHPPIPSNHMPHIYSLSLGGYHIPSLARRDGKSIRLSPTGFEPSAAPKYLNRFLHQWPHRQYHRRLGSPPGSRCRPYRSRLPRLGRPCRRLLQLQQCQNWLDSGEGGRAYRSCQRCQWRPGLSGPPCRSVRLLLLLRRLVFYRCLAVQQHRCWGGL